MARNARSGRGARRRRNRRRRAAPGTSPGTVMVDPDAPRPVIRLISYDRETVSDSQIDDVNELPARMGAHLTHWINVDGLGDEATLRALAGQFRLHRLALEDVVNTNQRAKVERYPDQLYIVSHEIHAEDLAATEQVSMFLGSNYVLTFQEREGDAFDPVRKRIRAGFGRMREAGSGYLAYALLDAIVDYYFPVLETIGEQLERLEEEVLNRPTRRTMHQIHGARRSLLILRRSMWPMRDALHTLLREESPLINAEDRYYLQDCHDHAMRVLEMIDSSREVCSSLLDVHLSNVSNRTNEIMKVLTMFTSIFIPLSFIASIYGMNFDTRWPWNMPELTWRLGYPAVLALMAVVAGGLLYYFARMGWIGESDNPEPAEQEVAERGASSSPPSSTPGAGPPPGAAVGSGS